VIDAWWDERCLTRACLEPRIDNDIVIITGSGFCLRADDGTVLKDTEGRIQTRLYKDKTYIIERKEEGKEC
jgi:hypothetical protein